MTNVTIGKGVISIDGSAFSDCDRLTDIQVAGGNENFVSVDGILYNAEKTELVVVPGGHSDPVTIPEGITIIGNYAFCSCDGLTSITIPEGVTSIGYAAFNGCRKLADVYYGGTKRQWNRIQIADYNTQLVNATIHFGSVDDLEIRPAELSCLVSGKMQTLVAYYCDDEQQVEVTWSVTEGSDYATISSAGKLTAKNVTQKVSVTVTATGDNAIGTKNITILPKATSVTIGGLESATVDMHATSTLTLTATTAPEDALNDVTWVSGNEKVATVDETGTATLLKPGTVTITATTTDGSKKSAKVTLTVYYLDKAAKLTATSDAPALGLQPGQTATVTVSGSSPLEQSALYFSIPASQQNIATVDENTGVVTAGATPGTATVTAVIRNDPLNRKVTCKVKVIDMQAEALELSAVAEESAQVEENMVILDAKHVSDGAYTFTASSTAKDYDNNDFTPTVTWVSSNTSIATVKDNKDGTATVTVKKGASGECAITATAKDQGKVSANLWLSVRDYQPRISTTTPEMNLCQSSSVTLDLLQSYGYAIVPDSVALCEKEEISQHFKADWEEGVLTISALEGTGKGTYTQTLKVTCQNGEHSNTYAITLKIKVTDTQPAITVKQTGKYNLFYTDSAADFTLAAKGATIRDAMVLGTDFDSHYDGEKLHLTGNHVTNPGKKLTLRIWLDGYEKAVDKPVTLSTVTTAPKLKLSAASSIINTQLGKRTTTFRVLDGTKALNLENMAVTYSGSFATHSITGTDMTLTLTGNKGGSATIQVRADNWTKTVKLTHNVTVQATAPTLKLAATTLKLNSVFPETKASAAVSLSQSNLKLKNVTITSTSKAANGAEKMSVTYEDGQIIAKIRDEKNLPKAGTYTFSCVGWLDESTSLKAVTLKVTVAATSPNVKLVASTFKLNRYLAGEETVSTKVNVPAGYILEGFDGLEGTPLSYKDGLLTACLSGTGNWDKTYLIYPLLKQEEGDKPVRLSNGLKVKLTTYSADIDASVTTKGKLDTLDSNSAITCTVKLKNCLGSVSDVSLAGQDGALFQVKLEDGKILLMLKPGQEYTTGKSYKVVLDISVCGKKVSKELNIKVTQSTLKVSAAPSSVTCYQALGRTGTTLRVTSPATAQIDQVTLGSKTASAFLEAMGEEGGLTFNRETGRVAIRLQNPALLATGKSYTVFLDVTPRNHASNAKPVQLRLTVKVKG